MLHRITLESLGLLHIQSPDENGEGGDDTETKRETPDGPEVVRSKAVISLGQRVRSREVVGKTNIQ